jgi:CSLREA domain-containing protein
MRTGTPDTAPLNTKHKKEIRMNHLFLPILLALPLVAQANTITVDTTEDLPGTPGTCSLREAIQAVIDTTAQDGCPAGSAEDSPGTGKDTIVFDLSLPATITLTAPLPALDDIDDGVTISGPGGGSLTINGADQFRVFRILPVETVVIQGLTIANGRSPKNGGAIQNFGQLTVRSVNFVGNSTLEDGGAVSNEGVGARLTVLNSTFSGNFINNGTTAEEEGGAIVNIDATATIANSTFFGNSVPNTGGAIETSGAPSRLTLINSTINSNIGGVAAGGVFSEKGGILVLRNTLLAANPGNNCGTDSGGVIVDEGGNLDDGTTCGLTVPMSLPNAVAGLDPAGLQNNGGPTNTIALTAASDAIDLGLNNVCAEAVTVNNLDQRGATRPIDGDGINGAACDTGAFESGAVPPPSQAPPAPGPSAPPIPPLPPLTQEPAPVCSGRTATVYVQTNDLIKGGPDDGLFYNGRLRGTQGADVMVGTARKDVLIGFGGNDRICGGGGKDTIKGSAGNDRLFGQGGKDKLSGGGGFDRCVGGRGKDTFTTCERVVK